VQQFSNDLLEDFHISLNFWVRTGIPDRVFVSRVLWFAAGFHILLNYSFSLKEASNKKTQLIEKVKRTPRLRMSQMKCL